MVVPTRRGVGPAVVLAVLGGVLAVALAGCSAGAATRAPADGPVQVVTTMSVLADLVRAVGGDHVQVRSLVGVGGDPHTHQPTPSDAVALAEADVVVDNGLGLSPWFDALAGGVRGRLVVTSDGVADRALDEAGVVDPHLWMVPRHVVDGYVPAIHSALVEAAPQHRDAFAAGTAALVAELEALDAELHDLAATIPPSRRLLVTSHDAYRYFAEEYGLQVLATVLGVTTEAEPSAADVAAVVQAVAAHDVPTIFVETTVNPDVVMQVAREAGVEIGEPLYGDSVGPPGSGADTYVGMLRANMRAIVAGLAAGGTNGR